MDVLSKWKRLFELRDKGHKMEQLASELEEWSRTAEGDVLDLVCKAWSGGYSDLSDLEVSDDEKASRDSAASLNILASLSETCPVEASNLINELIDLLPELEGGFDLKAVAERDRIVIARTCAIIAARGIKNRRIRRGH